MKKRIGAGITSNIDEGIFLQDSSSAVGAGLTGLAHGTAGLTCYYKRSNGTGTVAVSLAAITTLGTFASGGFKEIDSTNQPGMYEFHPPDAAFAAGATSVTFYFVGATNLAPRPIQYEITPINPQASTTPVDLQTIKTQSVTATGGFSYDAQTTAQTSIASIASGATTLKANLVSILGTALTETVGGYLAAAFKKFFNVASPTLTMDTTGTTLTAVPDTAGTTTLVARLTSARAGYLDNLNVGGVVASHADITALNLSASKHISITTSEQYAPSQAYLIELRTYNAETGALVDADVTPTITATGNTSGSLAANLGSVAHIATGIYQATYTTPGSPTFEQITISGSATISSAPYSLSCFAQTVAEPTATFTATDKSNLTAITNKLPSKLYLAGTGNSTGALEASALTGNYAGSVGGVAGDLAGKVLGGGGSAITGAGAWALDDSGAALGTAAVLATSAASAASAATQTTSGAIGAAVQAGLTAQGYTALRAGYLANLSAGPAGLQATTQLVLDFMQADWVTDTSPASPAPYEIVLIRQGTGPLGTGAELLRQQLFDDAGNAARDDRIVGQRVSP